MPSSPLGVYKSLLLSNTSEKLAEPHSLSYNTMGKFTSYIILYLYSCVIINYYYCGIMLSLPVTVILAIFRAEIITKKLMLFTNITWWQRCMGSLSIHGSLQLVPCSVGKRTSSHLHASQQRAPLQQQFVKYLGIQINSDLSWSPHVANLCNKARRLIGLLYRCFSKHADTTTLLQLYKSFICPLLEYCSIVWDSYLLGDTEALQRFALRVCLKNWSGNREDLYTQSNIPVLAERQSHARLCHV